MRVRRARETRGWSIETLADAASVDVDRLLLLEAGDDALLLRDVLRVAEALGVTLTFVEPPREPSPSTDWTWGTRAGTRTDITEQLTSLQEMAQRLESALRGDGPTAPDEEELLARPRPLPPAPTVDVPRMPIAPSLFEPRMPSDPDVEEESDDDPRDPDGEGGRPVRQPDPPPLPSLSGSGAALDEPMAGPDPDIIAGTV